MLRYTSSYAEAAELGRELGDNLALGASLRGLGIVAIRQREFNVAASHMRKTYLHCAKLEISGSCRVRWIHLLKCIRRKEAYDRAARLLGAAATAREAAFNTAWTTGQVLRLREAIEYALNGNTFVQLTVPTARLIRKGVQSRVAQPYSLAPVCFDQRI